MTATREEVYAAIDSERDYQDQLTRHGVPTETSQGAILTPMEQLAIIRRIIRDAEDWWYENAGELKPDFMRKIAGTAVRTMEQHGAPRREGF